MPLSTYVISSSLAIAISFFSIMDLSRDGQLGHNSCSCLCMVAAVPTRCVPFGGFKHLSLFQTLKIPWVPFFATFTVSKTIFAILALPGIALGLFGQHSANTKKSWHRNLFCFDIDFDYSTQRSFQRWTTPQEHGPSQKRTKEWSSRRSSKCFTSSYKREENTKNNSKEIWQ